MKKLRAFKRDAYLGIRMPDDAKRRLSEVARRKLRDNSSLALEYIVSGVKRDEVELQKQTTPS